MFEETRLASESDEPPGFRRLESIREAAKNDLDRKFEEGEVTLNIKLGERRTARADGLFDDYLTNKREAHRVR